VENGGGRPEGERGRAQPPRTTIYSLIVGLVFLALIAVAGINLISTKNKGVLGSTNESGKALSQFAVPDARAGVPGDANIAQDDCDAARIPCPAGSRRTPACDVRVPGAIRVCDFFDRPLVLSFWFTRGGDCEDQQDVFEQAYRHYRGQVNFLAIDVRDSDAEVRKLIAERNWTHPIGLDRDGGLSNLYRVGGCPTFVYAYPGGIIQATSIGQLDHQALFGYVDRLIRASRQRAATLR
jgi:thiol-disulfide isomerase/thioredoxin